MSDRRTEYTLSEAPGWAVRALRDRDEARAECERLRAEHERLIENVYRLAEEAREKA